MNLERDRIRSLAVDLHGRRAGIITRLGGERYLFDFEQDYIDDASRPTLSLSFKGQTGGLVTTVRPVARNLPAFFSNLLPEGHLRAYLAQKAGVKPEPEFFLMAILGSDLPGAVLIKPLDREGHGIDDAYATGDRDDEQEPRKEVLRFSLAGVQLKFSAVIEACGGLTIPAQGIGGSWIVKLPSIQYPSVPENEFLMLELARAIGIQVPQIRLVPVADIQGLPRDAARLKGDALAVERFDRAGDRHMHMEDFAQVFGLFPDEKYERRSYANIAAVLWAETGHTGTYEFMRRLVFSVLIGNGDMHLKNWSLLYPDTRTPVLAPAYDFVSTLPYIPDDRLALTFGGSRSLDEITLDQVRRFTETAHLPMKPVWEIVRQTVEQTVAAWKTLGHKDLISADTLKIIGSHIDKVAANTEKQT